MKEHATDHLPQLPQSHPGDLHQRLARPESTTHKIIVQVTCKE